MGSVATVSIETAASIRSKFLGLIESCEFFRCLFVHVHEFMHDLGNALCLVGMVEVLNCLRRAAVERVAQFLDGLQSPVAAFSMRTLAISRSFFMSSPAAASSMRRASRKGLSAGPRETLFALLM